MKVLVACEESQRVCSAFRKRGHEAYSCDVIEPSGGHPEWHVLGDALITIEGGVIKTMDGEEHYIGRWDLIIAHPPCTYLSAASAVRLFNKDHEIKDWARYAKMEDAAKFFKSFLNADAPRICVENPVPLKIAGLPKYSQVIEPYWFGEPWKKRTCLWLKNLPPLEPTNMVEPKGYWIGAHGVDKAPNGASETFRDHKTRSKTFIGIAEAMSEQWNY